MKKQLKSLLLVAFFACTTLPAWSQASTQGKEFWVSSSIVCSPSNGKGIDPYLAVSAEKACMVTITGGVGNAINISQQVDAGSWTEFNSANGLAPDKWYPINTKEPATVCNLAGQKNMYGLHITATENISVYVILRGENSMDASNILPLTALGSEYYVQDYTPEAHNDKSWNTNEGNMVTVTTILGTEDGTKVEITPDGATYDGHASGTTYTIDLNKGQTYYLISQKEKQLAGTHIYAKNDRKIAIYTGLPLTRLPNGVSARDALFEQPMPVEYWGTQFIVTRSLGKNGNLIGITASTDGTEIKLDGYSQNPAIIIDEGETYYIMLQNAGDPQTNKPGTSHVDKTLIGDALYIETSCPCQVYSYDTGNGFVGKVKDAEGTVINELIEGQKGDPSSVWVSPIQQKINKITFGACYTNLTRAHFLNVITETANCTNTKLSALSYNSILQQIIEIDKSSLLTWQPVPGNPTYSYARAQIGDDAETYKVFRLENAKGFIATVYGNGNDESYAYSAGSAAVEQGVNVNGITFINGNRSDEKFCIENEFSFDAKVGTDEITRVDWDFGDGTTDYNGLPQVNHLYSNPGWYDVTAELYGSQVCTNESEQFLGTVTFSFRVVRADTVAVAPTAPYCLSLQEQADTIAIKGQAYLDNLVQNGIITILNPDAPCYEDKQIGLKLFGLETEETKETLTGKDQVTGYNGTIYYESTDVEDLSENRYGCTHHTYYHVEVLHCLQMDITNNPARQRICAGDNIRVAYTKHKGNIDGDAHFIVPAINWDAAFVISDENVTDSLTLPASGINKPGVYQGKVVVRDKNCNEEQTFPIEFNVNYPRDIVAFKFNNVLAVYKPGYGGNDNYTFSAYQWFVNGQAVPNATNSVYHAETPFQAGDIVYVLLTDNNGQSLPSCPLVITSVPDLEPQQQHAPARKLILDQHMFIDRAGTIYDIYGQKVRNR